MKRLSLLLFSSILLQLPALASDIPQAPKNCEKAPPKICHQRVQEAFALSRNYGFTPSNTKASTVVYEPACKKGDALACAWRADELRADGEKWEVYSKIFGKKTLAKLYVECTGNDMYSCEALGVMAGASLGPNAADGQKDFIKSCELGLAAGCYEAAIGFQKGIGTDKSDQKFEEMLSKGCEMGDGMSCVKLAATYQNGFMTISKAPDKAFQTIVKGCDHGYAPACDMAGFFSQSQNNEANAKDYRGKACKLGYSADCK